MLLRRRVLSAVCNGPLRAGCEGRPRSRQAVLHRGLAAIAGAEPETPESPAGPRLLGHGDSTADMPCNAGKHHDRPALASCSRASTMLDHWVLGLVGGAGGMESAGAPPPASISVAGPIRWPASVVHPAIT